MAQSTGHVKYIILVILYSVHCYTRIPRAIYTANESISVCRPVSAYTLYLPLSLSLPCRARRGKRLAEEREGRERGEVRGSWTSTIASNHPTAFLCQRAPYRRPTGHHAIFRHFYTKFLIFNF